MNRHPKVGRLCVVVGSALVLSACASSGKMPSEDLTAAKSAVQQAEAADARDFEPVMLNNVQNKISDAQDLIDAKKYDDAEMMLEKATVDAQLAAAKSETQKAQNAVDEINRNIEQMRQRINAEQQ